nr:unnamed protein product [Callosobruchus chinensis]
MKTAMLRPLLEKDTDIYSALENLPEMWFQQKAATARATMKLLRKCGEAVETAKHVIFDCPAVCRRSSYLEVVHEEGRQVSIVQCIIQFAKNLGWDSV